ncbi:MAG: amidohydrolase [Kosmotoga sp.]|uniref:M20 metallopeptidase family protein n=1 Tax=Kosmotoga sp. TaxID=1955248 RepID=UPI0025BA8682|nr:M20 family metallopeptidase [Kosmotoga sp.]MCD6160674.1 amidohydrolase [Kosmotoga sp.]
MITLKGNSLPIELRHKLHMYPEGGHKEFKTKNILLEFINDLNCKNLKIYQLLKTAILVEYTFKAGDAYTLFRADMDALPIEEKTGVEFHSKHSGWMHACGHDVHMAVLFGLIQRVCEDLPNKNILFLFQPAEEGPGGAKPILESGVLDRYTIKAAFALHVNAEYDLGTVASKDGVIFASPTEFEIRFRGKSTHGSTPSKGKDTILPAAQFIQSLYASIPMVLSNDNPHVLSVGKISGGQRKNIIADYTELEGTYRVMEMSDKAKIDSLITRLVKEVSDFWGIEGELNFLAHYPTVVNSRKLFEKLKETAEKSGLRFIKCKPKLTGEDFGFFSHKYPSLLFWLGCGTEDMRYDLHTPEFLPPDAVIEKGIMCMYNLLLTEE